MNNKFAYILIGLLAAGLIYSNSILPKQKYAKGKKCFESGNIECAVQNLHDAYYLKPSVMDYEYYYAKSLSKAEPTYDIQKAIYLLYTKAKSESAKSITKNRIKEIRASIISSIGDNYIEQAPSETNIIRWNKESFPLNVYISKTANVPDYYYSSIKRALALWAKSVSFIDFNLVNRKSNADIIIDIEQLPSDVCVNNQCKYVVGYTSPTISGHTLKNMKIILYDKDPSGTYFSDKDVFNTMAHELGHSLGIMGHSYSVDDLMYPTQNNPNKLFELFRNDFHTLSGKDINTIELLYRLEPTITNKPVNEHNTVYTPIILGNKEKIINKKIEEAEDYINNSPELASGYIDLAGAYIHKGEFKLAEATLLKAIALAKNNSEKYIIYYNLVLINCKLKNFRRAEEFLNKAKSVNDTQELAELENIVKNKMVPTF